MREILFRGKRVTDGEWLVGSLWVHIGVPKILTPANNVGYDVDPDTVGQCTGLKDKNGNRIFEGDVVEGHCHSAWRHELQRCEVAYGRDGFEARHHVECGGEQRYFTYKVLFSKDVVVIGNIHDNPELIGGGES